ncbi:MAG: ABC transporter permease subunit [Candidatus Cloacimonetes bacterium]|jgi:Cu-processing system permease protein|nr:ABC transporter permease subunit [Candidatus Cloacimonadota bacterium]
MTTLKILKYELADVVRGRWLPAYAGFFLLATEALLRFGGTGEAALLSLMNVVLFVAPLMSLIFGAVYLYGAREFNELLLSQPVSRRQLFGGLYLGLALPLALAFALGVGIPFAARLGATGGIPALVVLLAVGIVLTLVFTAVAFLIAVRLDDRAQGLGAAVLLWLLVAVVYDGLVMLGATIFADYPLEKPLLALMVLNPLDLARVILLMTFDAAALMGYTGAVFQRFFGSPLGLAVASTALAVWIALPLTGALQLFRRKDF